MKRKTTAQFIEQARKIHINKYDYSEVEYINTYIKIKIHCNICKTIFLQTPNAHLQKIGCPKCASIISKKETKWLDFLNISEENRHKLIYVNDKRFNVDGFISETNTILEFNGDYWHGNKSIYKSDEINLNNKKTFGELYQKTLNKEKALKEAGYTVISIWEKDFKDWAKSFSIKWQDVSKEDLTPEQLEALYKLSNINNINILKAA